jgi:hypothetical protein
MDVIERGNLKFQFILRSKRLTACIVPNGLGFVEFSFSNFSSNVEPTKLLSEAAFLKASFFSSKIFLSA